MKCDAHLLHNCDAATIKHGLKTNRQRLRAVSTPPVDTVQTSTALFNKLHVMLAALWASPCGWQQTIV